MVARCTRLDRSAVVLALAACLAGCGSGSGSAASGSADGGADGGGNCLSGATTPCTSFTTPTGVTVQLGPYGAIMDPNVGTGFENQIQMGDNTGDSTYCQMFASIFAQSPALTSELLNTNQAGVNLNFALYTVYRPATWPSGPIPVITWGNGTCAQPEGYGALLRYVASYGFFVVAANSREAGSGTPPPMLNALTYAAAANMDSTSPYYQKLDMTRVGAMGHSQGGAATATASSDVRIKDIIMFSPVGATLSSVTKPYLVLSGDNDIAGFTPTSMASDITAATVPAAGIYFHMVPDTGNFSGHLTLMLQPQRVVVPTKDWWLMMLESDATSKSEFEGSNCGLCNMASELQFEEQGLD
jgi:hypothetical protein